MKKNNSRHNNVIHFPISKGHPRFEGQSDGSQSKVPHPKKTKVPHFKKKKVIVSASLVSILFLVTWINRSLEPATKDIENTYAIHMRTPSSTGRRIASVKKRKLIDGQEQLVRHLAQPAQRAFASIGRKPTAQESFIYGDFSEYQNKYILVFDEIDKHLVSMKYILPISSHHVSGMLMSTPESFFSSHKSIFPKKAVALVPVEGSENHKEKVYNLLDSEDKTIGKVKFTTAGTNGEYLYSYQTMN